MVAQLQCRRIPARERVHPFPAIEKVKEAFIVLAK
jgi:hypothetical protein